MRETLASEPDHCLALGHWPPCWLPKSTRNSGHCLVSRPRAKINSLARVLGDLRLIYAVVVNCKPIRTSAVYGPQDVLNRFGSAVFGVLGEDLADRVRTLQSFLGTETMTPALRQHMFGHLGRRWSRRGGMAFLWAPWFLCQGFALLTFQMLWIVLVTFRAGAAKICLRAACCSCCCVVFFDSTRSQRVIFYLHAVSRIHAIAFCFFCLLA